MAAIRQSLGRALAIALAVVSGLITPVVYGPVGVAAQPAPRLTLTPDQGPPATSVTAEVTGYGRCPPASPGAGPSGTAILIIWEERILAGPVDLADDGSATTLWTVPAAALPGQHVIVAKCTSRLGLPETADALTARAAFLVTPATASEPAGRTEVPAPTAGDPTVTGPGTVPWWPILALVTLGTLIGVVWLLRIRRGRRWVRSHVRVVGSTPGYWCGVTEASRDVTPPTLTVRIEPHPDRGRQVLEEVEL